MFFAAFLGGCLKKIVSNKHLTVYPSLRQHVLCRMTGRLWSNHNLYRSWSMFLLWDFTINCPFVDDYLFKVTHCTLTTGKDPLEWTGVAAEWWFIIISFFFLWFETCYRPRSLITVLDHTNYENYSSTTVFNIYNKHKCLERKIRIISIIRKKYSNNFWRIMWHWSQN